jgi:hypothetical protein
MIRHKIFCHGVIGEFASEPNSISSQAARLDVHGVLYSCFLA